MGWLIYQLTVIRVRGMPTSEIIVTFAISLAILEFLCWRGLRGATYVLPVFHLSTIHIYGVPVDAQRIIAVVITAVIVLALWLFTHYTKVGLGLRAIAQNERAALLQGLLREVIVYGIKSLLVRRCYLNRFLVENYFSLFLI